MVDTKISDLPDGTALQTSDEMVLARASASFKFNPTDIVIYVENNTTTLLTSADTDGVYLTTAEGNALFLISALTTAQVSGFNYITSADTDGVYLTTAEGNALFLTSASADILFLTTAEGDGRYLISALTTAQVSGFNYITSADTDGVYLTTAEGSSLFLTSASADSRYLVSALTTAQVSGFNYITSADTDGVYLTTAEGCALFLTTAEGDAKYIISVSSISAGIYGTSAIIPRITVDSNGIITSIIRVTAEAAGGGDPDQNLWETMAASAGTAIANIITDTFNILGDGTIITTSITGDTLTVQYIGSFITSAETDGVYLTTAEGDGRYLISALTTAQVSGFNYITSADTDGVYLTTAEGNTLFLTTAEGDAKYLISVSNVCAGTYGTSTLIPQITVGTDGVITEIVRVTAAAGGGGDPDQNLWETMAASAGTAIANIVTDTFTILGDGSVITTSITGDTLTVEYIGSFLTSTETDGVYLTTAEGDGRYLISALTTAQVSGFNYITCADLEGAGADSVELGHFASAKGSGSIAIGLSAVASGDKAVAIGPTAVASANEFVLGISTHTVIARGTFRVCGSTALLTSANTDGIYLTTAEGDANYLISALTTAQVSGFNYITSADTDGVYLTTAEGDGRYLISALTTAQVSGFNYITSADTDGVYLTTAEGDANYLISALTTAQVSGFDYITSQVASARVTSAGRFSFLVISTGREVSAGDEGLYLRTTGTTALEINIPTCASVTIPFGAQFYIRQAGTGTVTISARSGVTLNVPVSTTAETRGQHTLISFVKISSDAWDLNGDLAPMDT